MPQITVIMSPGKHKSTTQLHRSFSVSPKRHFSSMNLTPASPAQITDAVKKVLQLILDKHPWYYSHARLQYISGCRVSEAFNTSLWVMDESGRYVLQPNKGNNLRTFPPEWTNEIQSLIMWINAYASQYVSESNYRRVVRHAFRMVGLYHASPKGLLLSGCHTFRHAYVKRALEFSPTWEELLRNTGEKTTKALSHYTDSLFYIAN